jgi:large subunit ribosomal protein L18
MYAQLIDSTGKVLAASSTLTKDYKEQAKEPQNKSAAASIVGQQIAQKAIQLGVTNIAFDRSGYLYHGRVEALADAARKAGLKF